MNLLAVDPSEVSKVWPHVRDLIYKAMKRGGLSSYSSVELEVLEGLAQLWIAYDEEIYAAAVTQLHETEWGRSCVITALGGREMDKWLPFISEIEKYAKGAGCEKIRIFGRLGWERKLPTYKTTRIILEKDL